MRVQVEQYNPFWAQQFEDIKVELQKALVGSRYESIEHVGSTSIPGLAAKPILDIDVVIESTHLEEVTHALVERGRYQYMGEWGVPDRHAFRKPTAFPVRNLYVCIAGSPALRNHLAVRDICRRDAAVRDTYGKKKLDLAKEEWADVDEYCEAKNEILAWVLGKAGMSWKDRAELREVNTNTNR